MQEKHKIKFSDWQMEYSSRLHKDMEMKIFIKELAKLGLKPDKPKEK
jgi:hypothetical protein